MKGATGFLIILLLFIIAIFIVIGISLVISAKQSVPGLIV